MRFGTHTSTSAEVKYEIPIEAITEVIQSDPEVIQSDSELTVRLINELKVNSQLSRSRLSEILGCSERQVRKAIDALRAQGKILRVGSDTNGRWIVVEE